MCGGFYLFRGNSFDFFVAVVFHFVLYDRKTIAFKSVNVTNDQRHRKAALNWNLNWAEPPPQMRFWLQKSYHSSPPKYGLDRQIGSWGVSSRLIIMRSPAHFPHSFIKYTDTLLCGVLSQKNFCVVKHLCGGLSQKFITFAQMIHSVSQFYLWYTAIDISSC